MASKQFNSVDGYAVGNATIVIDSNGNVSGNAITATANVTAPRFISNVTTGTSPFVVSSTTVVANLNANALQGSTPATANTASTIALRDANGNISANFFIGNGSQLTGISGASISNGTSNVSIATSGGNVTTSVAGNANILIVTGTGANVSGTFQVSGVSNLGPNGNVIITGGSSGQVLTTNGTGTLSWTTPPGSAGGSPTVWVATTTNYTMSSGDDAVVSTATGNITVTLPNASTVKSYYFQNSSSNFLMTLQTVSSQLINNSSNLVIQFNGSSCRLISDGTKFYIF